MFAISLRQHQPHKRQNQWNDSYSKIFLRHGVHTRRTAKIEFAEEQTTPEKGHVVEIVILVESIGVVSVSWIVVL